MTLGKDGAIASNGLETIRFETLAKEVVDTTGAGDAFWSGFYTSIIKGYSIREALNLGFAVSAYKLPPFPSFGDRGFAPLTYLDIEPKFGTWEDIKTIGENFDILVDLMVNHISSGIFVDTYARLNPRKNDFLYFTATDECTKECYDFVVIFSCNSCRCYY
ncbi:PfkB family carbohydrate kinase [Clostridium sp. YIM B02555]|uniref:carbohydrate kinase family protein n=1 Tax=Clostridium sp. YIM B02555 TaxID=2911968 RepID=UPI001EED8946|nr:PfkB family carbohydrate kinase [Clostridium sp. YIM B02555]